MPLIFSIRRNMKFFLENGALRQEKKDKHARKRGPAFQGIRLGGAREIPLDVTSLKRSIQHWVYGPRVIMIDVDCVYLKMETNLTFAKVMDGPHCHSTPTHLDFHYLHPIMVHFPPNSF
ncbi:hypothetical protein MANES_13G009550v8 [Manihot esculenta]|uniref:Uncharacterized protein n=1 Tax=Manihot esculenta TaxID=3983 RepID=A0ACB7GKD2_MANES|nr:hypothetical protein MANES_13G009550v8 [Manihot esculenta]